MEVYAASHHMGEPKIYDSLLAGLYTYLLSPGVEFERFVILTLRGSKTAKVMVAVYQVEIVCGQDFLVDP